MKNVKPFGTEQAEEFVEHCLAQAIRILAFKLPGAVSDPATVLEVAKMIDSRQRHEWEHSRE